MDKFLKYKLTDYLFKNYKADLVNLTEAKKYITFTIVLLIWEIIPTSVIMILFRLKRSSLVHVDPVATPQASVSIRKSVFLESPSNQAETSRYGFEVSGRFNQITDYDEENLINNKTNYTYGSINYKNPS